MGRSETCRGSLKNEHSSYCNSVKYTFIHLNPSTSTSNTPHECTVLGTVHLCIKKYLFTLNTYNTTCTPYILNLYILSRRCIDILYFFNILLIHVVCVHLLHTEKIKCHWRRKHECLLSMSMPFFASPLKFGLFWPLSNLFLLLFLLQRHCHYRNFPLTNLQKYL